VEGIALFDLLVALPHTTLDAASAAETVWFRRPSADRPVPDDG